ncbi:hypothetical protein ACFQX8_15535 [Klenkia terrae]|uniref:hypothetical protein n=1 Tax=Klenkia terrae TaxID=1052259 RepID=UPI0036098A68
MSTPLPTPSRQEQVRLWLVPTPGPALDPEPVVRLVRPGCPRPAPSSARGRDRGRRVPARCVAGRCPTPRRSRTAW